MTLRGHVGAEQGEEVDPTGLKKGSLHCVPLPPL